MTKRQTKAHELYERITDKNKVSEDFLYNAICYFDIDPENVVDLLNELPAENCTKLDRALADCREAVRKVRKETLESGSFSKGFHDPEIEDIIFYQFAHGEPIH